MSEGASPIAEYGEPFLHEDSEDDITAEVVRSLESQLDLIRSQDARCWDALEVVLRERGLQRAYSQRTIDGETMARVVTSAVERAMGQDWPDIERQVRRMVVSLRHEPDEEMS